MKRITACFTGHREIPPNEISTVSERLKSVLVDIIANGYRRFIAGGALGFDTLAAQTVLGLKEEHPDIELHLALPYPDQAKSWSEADVAEYERIKSAAGSVVYVSDHYFRGCMQKRNRYLVDQSSLCICYLTSQTGGTAYTVKYAEKSGITVLNVKRPGE